MAFERGLGLVFSCGETDDVEAESSVGRSDVESGEGASGAAGRVVVVDWASAAGAEAIEDDAKRSFRRTAGVRLGVDPDEELEDLDGCCCWSRFNCERCCSFESASEIVFSLSSSWIGPISSPGLFKSPNRPSSGSLIIGYRASY